MINYILFVKLYSEAFEYEDLDLYIAERGWEQWMDDFTDKKIVQILKLIFKLAKSNFLDLRNLLALSRAELSRKYKIPVRTLEDWEFGNKMPSFYVRSMYAYTIFIKIETEPSSISNSHDRI